MLVQHVIMTSRFGDFSLGNPLASLIFIRIWSFFYLWNTGLITGFSKQVLHGLRFQDKKRKTFRNLVQVPKVWSVYIAFKISYKIVALFTENYPSLSTISLS